jgi:translation initiation factor IF-2
LGKVRVFSLAKELGLQTAALLAALTKLGVQDANPAKAIDEETAVAVRELIAEEAARAREAAETAAAAAPAPAVAAAPAATTSPAAVATAARKAAPAKGKGGKVEETVEEEEAEEEEQIIEKLFAPRDAVVSVTDAGLVELERRVAELDARQADEQSERRRTLKPLPEVARRPSGPKSPDAVETPPVVAVLGHVDHGKTTLLDALRQTNVVDSEQGGITQHVGASEVVTAEGKRVVFIDTPGHEAFTAMRARGAQVTDIAIIVVAADDGVMPQTIEAINHVKAAHVPIIVAINKMDVPGANPDLVKQQLLEFELVPEEWGGDTIMMPVSALKREGLDELLEMILIVAEVQELWAEPEAEFVGVVIEASIDSSQGAMATVLVRNGTIKVGDAIICGNGYGRVRKLFDWRGKSVKSMGPGRPVGVVGLTDVPESGEIMQRVESVKVARQIAEERIEAERKADREAAGAMSLRGLFKDVQSGEQKELNIVLKGDVYGTVQAVESSILALGEQLPEVNITILHKAVGDITESDIMLAVASRAIIIGFNVDAEPRVRQQADTEGVEIRTYGIIYQVLDDIRAAMLGMLDPIYEDVLLGKAEVLQLFKVSRIGVIAGCRVIEGRAERNQEMVVMRGRQEVYRGKMESLKHFAQDASSVEAPAECGISTSNFRDYQVGDIIEIHGRIKLERTFPVQERERGAARPRV